MIHVAVCCSVLQCVAVCCSVLQCVAVCCSVLQCVAVCYSVLHYFHTPSTLPSRLFPLLYLIRLHRGTHYFQTHLISPLNVWGFQFKGDIYLIICTSTLANWIQAARGMGGSLAPLVASHPPIPFFVLVEVRICAIAARGVLPLKVYIDMYI